MKPTPITPAPADAAARKTIKPVICYPDDTLPRPDISAYRALRKDLELIETIVVPPREAATWRVPAGHFCRILCSEGPQVGDLNLFNANDLKERLYTGKTRALNGTHVGLSGGRLLGGAFVRYGRLLPDGGRDLQQQATAKRLGTSGRQWL